ncbi:MAG: hypothetical protein HKN09_01490, partial [Saprospiraceae bacterium]|nr:hypothetical protein [Saprospiraceae bacterium]
MKSVILIALLFACANIGTANDTLTYSYDQFIAQLKDHHPMMVRIALLNEQVDARQMEARGQFDPKLGFNNQRKNFDDKNYYNQINTELKAPIIFGA